MSPLTKSILAAVSAEPGEWSCATLAEDLDTTPGVVGNIIRLLRNAGHDVRLAPHALTTIERKGVALARQLHHERLSRAEVLVAIQQEFPELGYDGHCRILRYAGLGRGVKSSMVRQYAEEGLSRTEIQRVVGCSERLVRKALRAA